MQSKKPRTTRGKPKEKPKERLKPISLHPMDFDEAMGRLIRAPRPPRAKPRRDV